LCHLAGKKI